MSSGYTRQSASSIVASEVVRADPINTELNLLQTAFTFDSSGVNGHTHDGSSDEGSYVPLIADADGKNKVQTDTSNNRVGFFVEVSAASVEQFRVQDGVIVPVTTNDIDLGTSSVKFKNAYFAGTVNTASITATGTVTISGSMGADLSMGSNKITNLATPTADTDATTKVYVDDAYASVAVDAAAAAASATAAASSATSAATSATSAATSYDNFDDRYLGDKASDPATDNDGDALLTGALYYNTTSGVMKVYSGSAWQPVAVVPADFLQVANNLSDLDNVTTARTNLGLGSAALNNTGDFLQVSNNLSDLASVTTARTNLGLGSAALNDTGDFATAAQGTLADNARPLTEDVQIVSTSQAATAGQTLVLTASTLTITLPASPSAGDWVAISDVSGAVDSVIARNFSNIMSAAEDLTLDIEYSTLRLVYADATRGWVFA